MSHYKPGSSKWEAQYIKENTYWRQKFILRPKKSAVTGKWIWPFQNVWMKGLRLPGTWQKDRIEWLTESEYMFLVLKDKVNG